MPPTRANVRELLGGFVAAGVGAGPVLPPGGTVAAGPVGEGEGVATAGTGGGVPSPGWELAWARPAWEIGSDLCSVTWPATRFTASYTIAVASSVPASHVATTRVRRQVTGLLAYVTARSSARPFADFVGLDLTGNAGGSDFGMVRSDNYELAPEGAFHVIEPDCPPLWCALSWR